MSTTRAITAAAVVVVAALRGSLVSAQGDAHAEHDVRRPGT
ncbi:MAG: hypothetical protein ABJD07_15460 [Gemmatimonadaceae bacterium]